MAVDIGSAINSVFPTQQGVTQGLGAGFFWITIVVIILLFLAGGGVGIWFLIRHLQFNKKIIVWKERNGIPEIIVNDKAKELTYNIQGDSVFYLRKKHKYLPRGEVESGKNTYMYLVREDGEWVNFSLSQMNNQLKKSGVRFIHPDMRAFRSGMSKIMKDRFEKKSLFKEYAPIVVPIIFFLILSVALYFIVDRIVASENNLIKMTEISERVMDKAENVLSATNNICSNSGYIPGK